MGAGHCHRPSGCRVPGQMGELPPERPALWPSPTRGAHRLVNTQSQDYPGPSRKLIKNAINLAPGPELKGEAGRVTWKAGKALSPAWWHSPLLERTAEGGPPENPGNPSSTAGSC